MMSDDDDLDFTSTTRSSKNLGSLFGIGEATTAPPVASTAYVPPKQPKKDSAPRVMIASVIQAFSFGADQKWTPKGKMGVALLSNDNTVFQMILYLTKTQQITSVRITTTTVFTPQSNNYLSFQDDSAQNWSIMFDTKQALADFALQIVVAKAFLFSFKFDSIIQDVREGEGPALVDQDSVELTLNTYKLLENGTIQSTDSAETKPVRYKIGKNQHGKAFDDVVRGMKKTGQRVTIINTTLYNIEVTRTKKDKEKEKERSGSVTAPSEEQIPVEQKRHTGEEQENSEKSKLLRRIIKEGGQQMFHNPNQSSAFVNPYPQLSDDDSISVEFQQNVIPTRTISTPVPPVQFVQPGYHHPQALIQQQALYSQQQHQLQQQQQPYHDYTHRPASTIAPMGYQQMPMWTPSQYPSVTPTVPPTDMYYQQQQQQLPSDVRPLLTRISEKVDSLNDKFDAKNSTTYPNMETSILLANIQRIVKENETIKKDLFDRSAKVEEQNSKISELLDRNQRLIEQSHQTAEQRNVVVNNVSEQTAQKILDLEKQKVELTNNLSASTSKIADLQLQLNNYTQDTNENQTRLTSLTHKCEQLKDDLQKSETQRTEVQTKFDTVYEQYKNEKSAKKQLQANLNTLEEELTEVKMTCANLEKGNNERKTKYENERKRWQDDLEEQKQIYEKELDELRNKLRKQRTVDNASNSQEITRIEQELGKEWQEKFERQQTQHERLLSSKAKELEQLKSLFDENETKLQQTIEELNESKEETKVYVEQCEKLQERFVLMKEKLIEMNEEQPQLINEQIKRAINLIFQRLKSRIQPTKQYTGEIFLSKSLEIIKKVTLKVLSNNDEEDDEEEESDEQSEEENDQPTNGNSVDEQTLNEEVSSVQTEQINSLDSENSSNNTPKNGWDTVDDLQQETNIQPETVEQNQIVVVSEESTTYTADENETTTTTTVSESVIENTETIPSAEIVEQEHESDSSADTVEEDEEKPPPPEVLDLPKEQSPSDDEEDNELFQSARPSIQGSVSSTPRSSAIPKIQSNRNIPLLTNPDDSDDELFK